MHRLALLVVLGFGSILQGCDCGDDVKLEIVEPMDGAVLNLASDIDEDSEGVQIVVLVGTEGLDLGTNVTLSVNGVAESEPAAVSAGGVARFTPTFVEDGEYSLVARAEGVSSNTVTVTLDTGSSQCPDLTISRPDADTLTADDDEDEEPCGTFTYTVVASTNAQEGRGASLWVNGSSIDEGAVAGAEIRFEAATLDSGNNDIEVRLDGDGDCSVVRTVTVDCGVTCTISAPGGIDTLNASNDLYDDPGLQTDFVVDTDAEDGQDVVLSVDDDESTYTETAAGGSAAFAEVPLAEGERIVQAICRDAAGNEARSARVRFLVDSLLPEVVIDEPAADAVFGFSTDLDGNPANGVQVQVCATSSEDGEMCAAVAGAAAGPDGCAEVQEDQQACGVVTCEGDGVVPINLEAAVTDDAGNEGTATVTVRCNTGTPAIAIADPEDDDMLNASLDDQPGTAGMQYEVVVCTSAPAGSTVQLFENDRDRGSVLVVAEPCTADALGAEVDGTARFVDQTIAQGDVTLYAHVAGPGGNDSDSPPVDITVDSLPPTITWPDIACGAETFSPEDDKDGNALNGIQVDVTARLSELPPSDSADVTVTYADATTATFSDGDVDVGGFATFVDVTLEQGSNTLDITVTDAAGNVGSASCAVTANVGGFIRINSPAPGAIFSAATDPDGVTVGHQSVGVTVVSDGPTDNSMHVRVLADGVDIGGGVYDVGGGTTYTVTLPEGAALDNAVNLTATTTDHPGGTLTSSPVRVLVDTLYPATPGAISAAVLDARAGQIRLTFAAPADPSNRSVSLYQVRRSSVPFVGEGDGLTVTPTVIGGIQAPGSDQLLDVTGLFPGATYYFAVRAVDLIGNVGTSVSDGGTALSFTVDSIESPQQAANFGFGFHVAGGSDVNDDGFDDVIAGTLDGSNRAYLYYGSLNGLSSTPDVVFDGTGGASFGTKVAMMRDFNCDGVADVAIGDYFISGGAGAVYIYFGSDNLPAILAIADANVTITGSDADTSFGHRMAWGGDIDGDDCSDLLIGAGRYNAQAGEAFVVLGGINPPDALSMPADSDLRILGTVAGSRTSMVAPAGNLNGDGRDDFIVSGCRSGRVGTVYVFYGEDGAAIAADPERSATEADFTFSSANVDDDQHGCGVGGVGDVNNDGYGDIVVGTPLQGALDNGVFDIYASDGAGGFDAPTRITNIGANADGDQLGLAVAWTLGLEGEQEPSIDAGTTPDIAVTRYFMGLDPGGFVLYPGGGAIAAGDAADAPARVAVPAGGFSLFHGAYAGDVDADGFVDLVGGDAYVTVGLNGLVGRLHVFR